MMSKDAPNIFFLKLGKVNIMWEKNTYNDE